MADESATDGHRVAVVLASAGRPALLGETIADLARQTRAHTLVVSVPDRASLPEHGTPPGVQVVFDRGLTAQRNAGLAAVPDADFVFFFDDDAVVREDYLEHGVRFFVRHPEVVGITGRVLLDGAAGDEIPRPEAEAALSESGRTPARRRWAPSRELYGCNFAYRPADAGGERFDERLPLYSWLEDHDFARRLLRRGRLAKVEDCVIVHRGVKSGGRVAHTRLGYSQMMNPLYLHHKGSFPAWLAFREIVPRCGKNLVLAVAGPDAGWRRERLKGNAAALLDAMRGRFTPERMLEF
ncbi:glycosyltransferase family 2 protein [Lysobacter korlensis]|uniref:Glycosyltransferase family 2 protein n=1 Tax=Lysobacter korlensis TaxID=553636 RepID=A0ABV6RWP4_9GAMM